MTNSSQTDKPKAPETERPSPAERRGPLLRPGAIMRGRFELIEEIGRGGFSVVYRARDIVAAKAGLRDPEVALKIIVADESCDPDIVALMHREARRLRDLVHPNIVRVYDMDVQGSAHLMVMECLEGQTLAETLKTVDDRKLDAAKIPILVRDVSAALIFAHERGVIHADLKPGNVFIETNGAIKLIDFNIAYPVAHKPSEGEEDTIRILGRLGAVTPRYASPQRLEGLEPSPGDDVFSLGVLTYMAASGKLPFAEKNASEAREENVQPTAPGSLSATQWAALRRALAYDDKDRTATIADFARDFLKSGLPSIGSWFGIRRTAP
ncbi:MAG: serine/threonine-protein kinase [Pseudomonadota bacterium]